MDTDAARQAHLQSLEAGISQSSQLGQLCQLFSQDIVLGADKKLLTLCSS